MAGGSIDAIRLRENPQAADTVTALEYAGREFSVQQLGDVRNILHSHILSVLNGDATPEEALAAAQAEADEILSIYVME